MAVDKQTTLRAIPLSLTRRPPIPEQSQRHSQSAVSKQSVSKQEACYPLTRDPLRLPFDFVIAAACILPYPHLLYLRRHSYGVSRNYPASSPATPLVRFLARVFIFAGLLRWSHRWASSPRQSRLWLRMAGAFLCLSYAR
jgi:hypothetical protein